MPQQLRQGSIVQAFIVPPRGEPNWRPAMIYTPDEILAASPTVDIIGISGSYYPDNPDHVPLPWRADGNCPTRLTRPSATQLDLVDVVPKEYVRAGHAFVPARDVARILEKLMERYGRPS